MLRQIYRRVLGSCFLAMLCAGLFLAVPCLWVWRRVVQPFKLRQLRRCLDATQCR
jgi:hypothetical protein